ALLALLLTAGSAAAARVSYGEIEVAVDDPRGQPSHSYTEYRVQVYNRGSERARRVTLLMPATTFSGRGGGGLRHLSRTVEVGPGRVAVVPLLQPAAPELMGTGMTVYIDGRKQDDVVSVTPVTGHGGYMVYGR